MHHPMTPIELIASALSIIATGALIWWGLSHLISMAGELYERCRQRHEYYSAILTISVPEEVYFRK